MLLIRCCRQTKSHEVKNSAATVDRVSVQYSSYKLHAISGMGYLHGWTPTNFELEFSAVDR